MVSPSAKKKANVQKAKDLFKKAVAEKKTKEDTVKQIQAGIEAKQRIDGKVQQAATGFMAAVQRKKEAERLAKILQSREDATIDCFYPDAVFHAGNCHEEVLNTLDELWDQDYDEKKEEATTYEPLGDFILQTRHCCRKLGAHDPKVFPKEESEQWYNEFCVKLNDPHQDEEEMFRNIYEKEEGWRAFVGQKRKKFLFCSAHSNSMTKGMETFLFHKRGWASLRPIKRKLPMPHLMTLPDDDSEEEFVNYNDDDKDEEPWYVGENGLLIEKPTATQIAEFKGLNRKKNKNNNDSDDDSDEEETETTKKELFIIEEGSETNQNNPDDHLHRRQSHDQSFTNNESSENKPVLSQHDSESPSNGRPSTSGGLGTQFSISPSGGQPSTGGLGSQFSSLEDHSGSRPLSRSWENPATIPEVEEYNDAEFDDAESSCPESEALTDLNYALEVFMEELAEFGDDGGTIPKQHRGKGHREAWFVIIDICMGDTTKKIEEIPPHCDFRGIALKREDLPEDFDYTGLTGTETSSGRQLRLLTKHLLDALQSMDTNAWLMIIWPCSPIHPLFISLKLRFAALFDRVSVIAHPNVPGNTLLVFQHFCNIQLKMDPFLSFLTSSQREEGVDDILAWTCSTKDIGAELQTSEFEDVFGTYAHTLRKYREESIKNYQTLEKKAKDDWDVIQEKLRLEREKAELERKIAAELCTPDGKPIPTAEELKERKRMERLRANAKAKGKMSPKGKSKAVGKKK